jgi:hypothetical protein
MKAFLDNVGDWLKHPFFLALFTALVLNALTRRWGDRKESLQVRAALVSAMSETASNAFLAGDRAVRASGRTRPILRRPRRLASSVPDEESREAARTWERENAVIGTKLEAYFRSGGNHPAATESLSGVELTCRAVNAIHDPRTPIPTAWHWLGVAVMPWLEGERTGCAQWSKEEHELKTAKAVLIRRVLAEPIAVFRESWWFSRLWAHLRTYRWAASSLAAR